MKWKREESKKQKVNAKVDMYLVSFCLLGYSIEGYLSPSSFSLESSWECSMSGHEARCWATKLDVGPRSSMPSHEAR